MSIQQINMQSPKNEYAVSSVGKMAVIDLMNLMSTLMDSKLANIPSKQDLEEIKMYVNELSSKIDNLKSENQSLKSQIENLRREKEIDHQEIMYLQEHIKRNNVIFKGITVVNSLEDAVKECCSKNLKLEEEVRILSTRKLFERDGKVGIVAEFSSGEIVKKIFESTKNLAGSNIFLERDLTSEKQRDKRVMLELKKSIQDVSDAHHIFVRNEKIKIGYTWLWWNKSKQLVSGAEDGNIVLERLYGHDISIVNINYFEILAMITLKYHNQPT